jgi:hypothetical protein
LTKNESRTPCITCAIPRRNTGRGRAAYADANLRRVKSLEMISKSGGVGEREAAAYASEAYKDALEQMEDAVASMETIRALREAATYTIEVWRSQNSARKQGNI